jgi:hypothetical protein
MWFSIPNINYNDLCQTSVKQTHQYVCLIWRETWTSVFESSESKTEVKAILRLVAHGSLVDQSAW